MGIQSRRSSHFGNFREWWVYPANENGFLPTTKFGPKKHFTKKIQIDLFQLIDD